MPAEGIVGRILRLPGHGAIQMDFDETTKLSLPGTAGNGSNPEQLLAADWSWMPSPKRSTRKWSSSSARPLVSRAAGEWAGQLGVRHFKTLRDIDGSLGGRH
jgi:hypothetical protein